MREDSLGELRPVYSILISLHLCHSRLARKAPSGTRKKSQSLWILRINLDTAFEIGVSICLLFPCTVSLPDEATLQSHSAVYHKDK